VIPLYVLHHAAENPLYEHWMIAELRGHGYEIGPGRMYRLLHRLACKGYLLRNQQPSDSRYRKVYQITPSGRRALSLAKHRVQELFGELFARRLDS
jgi:PadR family transcriptional regulator, regulatory protein PadR